MAAAVPGPNGFVRVAVALSRRKIPVRLIEVAEGESVGRTYPPVLSVLRFLTRRKYSARLADCSRAKDKPTLAALEEGRIA